MSPQLVWLAFVKPAGSYPHCLSLVVKLECQQSHSVPLRTPIQTLLFIEIVRFKTDLLSYKLSIKYLTVRVIFVFIHLFFIFLYNGPVLCFLVGSDKCNIQVIQHVFFRMTRIENKLQNFIRIWLKQMKFVQMIYEHRQLHVYTFRF